MVQIYLYLQKRRGVGNDRLQNIARDRNVTESDVYIALAQQLFENALSVLGVRIYDQLSMDVDGWSNIELLACENYANSLAGPVEKLNPSGSTYVCLCCDGFVCPKSLASAEKFQNQILVKDFVKSLSLHRVDGWVVTQATNLRYNRLGDCQPISNKHSRVTTLIQFMKEVAKGKPFADESANDREYCKCVYHLTMYWIHHAFGKKFTDESVTSSELVAYYYKGRRYIARVARTYCKVMKAAETQRANKMVCDSIKEKGESNFLKYLLDVHPSSCLDTYLQTDEECIFGPLERLCDLINPKQSVLACEGRIPIRNMERVEMLIGAVLDRPFLHVASPLVPGFRVDIPIDDVLNLCMTVESDGVTRHLNCEGNFEPTCSGETPSSHTNFSVRVTVNNVLSVCCSNAEDFWVHINLTKLLPRKRRKRYHPS
jgi:hypothetical protein